MADSRIKVFRRIDMGTPEECWEWEGAPDHDRPRVTIAGRRYYVYRLVYELHTGMQVPKDMVIRHKCDNSMCCNPHHLEIGTVQDNIDDRTKRERLGLPDVVVRAVRKLGAQGRTHQEIADLYGIARESVTHIINMRSHNR